MQLARIRSPLTISDRLASSRSSAQQAVAEDNWWIRRHDARKIAWTSAETQRELARVVSSAASSSSSAAISEELPSGFWLPWETKGDAADGAGIVGLTVKIDDIKKVLEQEARPQGAAGVTAGGGSVRRKSLRRPIFAEFGCGSRRLANEMALFQWHTLSVDNGEKGIEPEIPKQWNRPEKDATLKTIKPSEVHPDMFHKSGDAVHYHVCGNIQDIDPSKLPTLAATHASPNCASTSNMATNHHPRDAERDMLAVGGNASLASIEWDNTVAHVRDIIRDQRRRKGNEDFGFTVEQPKTHRAREHLHMKSLMAPIANGGDGAELCPVDICGLGAPQQKATDFYVGQEPGIIEALRTHSGEPKYVCPGKSAWHKHTAVRGQTASSVRFHHALVAVLAAGFNSSYTRSMLP